MLGNLSCNVLLGYPTLSVMPSMLPKSHWEQFGSWIRKMRRDAELTQKDVSKKAGIHEVQIARIEKGESGTKRDTVIAIAKALGIDESVALNKAGFAQVEGIAGRGLMVPPFPKKPKNIVEFFEMLGNLGEFEFAGDLSQFTEDDFAELLERIKADVDITIRRKAK